LIPNQTDSTCYTVTKLLINARIMLEEENLTSREYSVYLYILSCVNLSNGRFVAWPSTRTLQKSLKMRRQTIINSLSSLEGKKLIFRDIGHGNKSTRYYLIGTQADTINGVRADTKENISGSTSEPPVVPMRIPQTESMVSGRIPEYKKDIRTKKLKIKKHTTRAHARGVIDYTPDFDKFWTQYPRKIGKQKAFKAWQARLKENHTPELMIRCLENYKLYLDQNRTEERYIKHPSTFLGLNRDFLDFREAPKPPQVNKVSKTTQQNIENLRHWIEEGNENG